MSHKNLGPYDAIVIYSGVRSGGTQVALNIGSKERFMVFYDPFNETLNDLDSASKAISDDNNLGHSSGMKYFQTITSIEDAREILTEKGDLSALHSYRKPSHNLLNKAQRLIKTLQSNAKAKGKLPVYKVESSLTLDIFMKAINKPLLIGLRRSEEEVFSSCLKQFVDYKNDYFARKEYELWLGHPLKSETKFHFDEPTIRGLFVSNSDKRVEAFEKCDFVVSYSISKSKVFVVEDFDNTNGKLLKETEVLNFLFSRHWNSPKFSDNNSGES